MSIMIVLQLMKTHVVKVSENASISEAIDLMDLYQVRGLPVVDSEGILCGYLSEKDIYKHLTKDFNSSASSIIDCSVSVSAYGEHIVKEWMTAPAITINENSPAMDVFDLMLCKNLKRIPVISDDRQLIGTINRIDIMRALIENTLT